MSDVCTIDAPAVTETTEAPAVTETTEGAAPTEAVAEKAPQAPRRRGHYDTDNLAVRVTEADVADVTFTYDDLPATMKSYLAVHGLWMFLRAAPTPGEGYALLVKGELPTVRVAVEKADEISPWKRAVAHALVEMTKKRETPMTIEEALVKASALDRKQLAAARLDPAVIKAHTKLFPPSKDAGSALAGLLA